MHSNIDKHYVLLAVQLYTVVRNVKQAHEVQESGETQEFQDDIDYIMDGLGDTQTVAIRCLRYDWPSREQWEGINKQEGT